MSQLSVRQILDFFESAPHLRKVELRFITHTPGAENGRLVTLACLKGLDIANTRSSSPLLDHLLIPAGAHSAIWVDLPSPPIEDHPPRFLDNFKNFPGFTTIRLFGGGLNSCPGMRFNGPNGGVAMIPIPSRADEISFFRKSLVQFDTSKTERLKIGVGNSPSSDPLYRALLPMQDLRTLTLSRCITPHVFIHALHPGMRPSGVVVCPKLEEFVIEYQGTLNIENVVGIAAAREFRGARLKLVRTIGQVKYVEVDVLELKKHVLHVECGPGADRADNDSDGSDEENNDGSDKEDGDSIDEED